MTLDQTLRGLRDLPALEAEGYTFAPATQVAWRALGVAVADWIDAARIDASGTYGGALSGLDTVRAMLPDPPKANVLDLVEIESLGRKAIEGPK